MASLCVPAIVEQDAGIGSSLYGDSRGPVELLPNPDFVFPARSSDGTSRQRQPSSIARRPRSDQNLAASANSSTPTSAHQTRASTSAMPLPSFSFNPAATSTGQASAQSTPPLSPMLSGPPTPSRTRHRRGGSELIGDGQSSSNVSIVSSSPKQSNFVAPPSQISLGPPAGRRHAHRRSGAISCHDLASIMQTKELNPPMRSGSAPTSPLDLEEKGFQFPAQAQHHTEKSLSSVSLDENYTVDQLPARRSFSRNRVGFADRVEYIRPLSTISSETEGSMSTVRGHSVNGSWSSIVSANNLSPVRRGRPSLDTTFEVDDVCRPTTCQSVIPTTNHDQDVFGVSKAAEQRPKSEAGCSGDKTTQMKPKSFSWWESKAKKPLHELPKSDVQPTATLSTSPPGTPKMRHSLDSDQETIRSTQADADRKKPRKVKSWAHSLIARKHKSKKDLRPATPPASRVTPSDDSDSNSLASDADKNQSDLSFNFDQDNTVTIVDEASTSQNTSAHYDYARAPHSPQILADNSGPVIDLDVAMSPVRSPLSPNARGQRQTRSRQSMHSATLTSGAFNFASQHRRTESAPQLKPFELRSAQPFTSTAMPDVFEEEDEEGEANQTADSASKFSLASTPSNITDAGASFAASTTTHRSESTALTFPSVTGFGSSRSQKTTGLAIDSGSRPTSLTLEPAETNEDSVCDSAIDLKIVGADDSIGSPSTTEERSSTPFSEYKMRAPPPLLYPVPLSSDQAMTPGTASDASVYSPFFSPSQSSLVGTRLDTGASSINETSSFCFGEPGPEVRISVDDVPSLSSSRSTMTSPAAHHGLPGSSGGGSPSIYSMRSATTTDFTRQKRGSIASLSRLVADRFERSKLSIETRPMTSSAESTIKAKKAKHRHGLSKLLSFWRTKETC